jgi:hypothetical protein
MPTKKANYISLLTHVMMTKKSPINDDYESNESLCHWMIDAAQQHTCHAQDILHLGTLG